MANKILTPTTFARETLAHLENDLVMAGKVHTDYSQEFTKKGDTINIERPVRFAGQKNNTDLTGYNEDIQEASFPLKINKTVSVKFNIDAKDMTLSIDNDRIQQKYIAPAVTTMKEAVETDLASLYSGVSNFVGTPGTGIETVKDLGAASIALTNSACPMSKRCALHTPETEIDIAASLGSAYVKTISQKAIEEASFGRAGNFDNYMSTHIPWHTVGNHGGTPLINGASQAKAYSDADFSNADDTVGDTNRMQLVTDGWSNSVTGLLKKGDVVTIAGVYAVNPVSKNPTGQLRTFVINQDVNSDGSGAATLNITPPIITIGAYQTCDTAPADNAQITVKTGVANTSYAQSLFFNKNAFTLVTRPLIIPKSSMDSKNIMGNKVSISVTEYGNGDKLESNYRLDMLYDVAVNHEMLACRGTN